MPTPMDAGYVMVAERHAQFVKDHPNGRIHTNVVHVSFDPGTGKGLVVVQASVWKEAGKGDDRFDPDGTGLSSMPIPGPTAFTKNSEVENAETSAVGRALAMIGYHAKETMASKDEIAMKFDTIVDAVGKALKTTDDRKATTAQLAKLMVWGKKLLGSEEEVRAFVARETGKHKRVDLTRTDIDTLFTMFKVMESTGGTVLDKLDGVE